ncbi:uncharacterized protein METZ01_LOCUS495508, partial [marine metagenome]
MGKIGAVPVEKEVVDAVPTRFKEPGKLDRVFRVGNIEYDQPKSVLRCCTPMTA